MKRYPDYASLRNDLLAGKTTCKERVQWHLDQISLKTDLNCFLSVFEQEAIHRAEEIDQKIKKGKAGKLAGMVVGIKDVLNYSSHPLQAASKILHGFNAQYTATAVQRLLDADAIIIGRQNCDEFGMGSSTENSAFGPTRNPADIKRTPGGSSGGSAAAVAADLCQISLGSDTGGSVRQPAAFCGVLGLKPTYSRVSRHGLIAYASSFDCIGVIANSVYDCAPTLEVIAGDDEFDSTLSKQKVPDYASALVTNSEKKFRIAVLENFPESGMSTAIKNKLREKSAWLKNQGHEIIPFHFPYTESVLPAYYILTTAEASSNLSRYDGVRYGHRTTKASDLESMYKKTRTEGFGDEVKRRILLGNFVLTSDYYDSYFSKAQQVRRLIRNTFEELFSRVDLLLMPTAPETAFPLGSHQSDPVTMYLADLFSVQANLAGLPAISVPSGVDNNGLPIGLQLMTGVFREEDLLAAAGLMSEKP